MITSNDIMAYRKLTRAMECEVCLEKESWHMTEFGEMGWARGYTLILCEDCEANYDAIDDILAQMQQDQDDNAIDMAINDMKEARL